MSDYGTAKYIIRVFLSFSPIASSEKDGLDYTEQFSHAVGLFI